MPLVEIEVINSSGGLEPDLPGRLADALDEALGARPGSTWVRLRALERSSYGESGGPIPEDLCPVFVHLLLARQDEAGEVGLMLERVTRAVAGTLHHRAENVHVVLSPDGAGRVAFGGRLVE